MIRKTESEGARAARAVERIAAAMERWAKVQEAQQKSLDKAMKLMLPAIVGALRRE